MCATPALRGTDRNVMAPMIITKYFAGTGKRKNIRIGVFG